MKRLLILIACLFCATELSAQTVIPMPVFQGLDNTGVAVAGGKLCTYQAGTSTGATTYTTSTVSGGGAVPNSVPPNAIVLDSAGRANVFLVTGQSYKFVLRQPGTDTTCSTGSVVWTQDNVSAIPSSSSSLDVLGTVGVTVTAGQMVYLSDGSGSLTAGQWFLSDSTNTYSSTTPWIGIAPAGITSGQSGTIRLGGSVTGLTGLAVGALQYVSNTPGATTGTAPANIRVVGMADTSTSLILGADPPPAAQYWKLLKANSGTDTNASATTVDSYALASQLTAKDSLFIRYSMETVTQATALVILQNSTDTVTMISLSNGGAMTAGDIDSGEVWISDAQSATTTVLANEHAGITTNTTENNGINVVKRTTFTTAWTGAWTLAFRHGGVTAGGTFKWSWAIYLVKGE